MNKLCCTLNPLYWCGECDSQECKECWVEGHRESHFKFDYEGRIRIHCRATNKVLISGKTFMYYGT